MVEDEPEAPEPMVPDVPDDMLPEPVLSVPVVAPVVPWERVVVLLSVLESVPSDCASAIEDTDATTTNETDLSVDFNVMT